MQLRTDNNKRMALFGRGVSTMIVFVLIFCLQAFALPPMAQMMAARDYPSVWLGLACVNLFNMVLYYIAYSFWFRSP